jgi:hypothetical protein
MTEIPEHLLKRSRDRRAALGLGGGDAATGSEAAEGAGEAPAATPATTASTPAAAAPPSGPVGRKAAPAPAEAPPPKPDPPYLAAAKSRARIPFWAMAALSLMPIWAFMYVRSLTQPPETVEGPMGVGAETFGACSSCHGASGQGGSGRPLAEGEVDKTFPHIEDQLRFVYFGTEQYNLAGVTSYGDPDREGGAHTTGSYNGGAMPGQGALAGGDLTDAEILAVVCHERFGLPGAPDVTGDDALGAEFELWCSEESPMYAALIDGTALADLDTAGITDLEGNEVDIVDIGEAPAPAAPASPL